MRNIFNKFCFSSNTHLFHFLNFRPSTRTHILTWYVKQLPKNLILKFFWKNFRHIGKTSQKFMPAELSNFKKLDAEAYPEPC